MQVLAKLRRVYLRYSSIAYRARRQGCVLVAGRTRFLLSLAELGYMRSRVASISAFYAILKAG